MFNTKFIIVLCAIGIVNANDDFRQLDSIYQEYPCSSEGGMCTIAADCPERSLAEKKGLCPQQRSIGVECCYGISVKETRCQKRGGACFPKDNPCNDALWFRGATDCPKDNKCCILI